ncbi:MAG: SpoIIE family protein phosphatase, partial [Solirubrobacterales bacterium]
QAARAFGAAPSIRSGPGGLLAGVTLLGALIVADVALDDASAALVGSYVIAPFVTALLAGPAATVAIGALAIAAAALSGAWNMNTGTEAYAVRIAVITTGTLFAVASAWNRDRSRARAGRLSLLDAVGDVADGSLPLTETLRRVIEVIVPAVGDICMVDAIHDGRASRLAARARGREDAEAVERGIMARHPSLPQWLVAGDRSWRLIPRWMPRMREEELRRMAQSSEDLDFLLSLGVRSSMTVPIAARDRNLGALTLVSAWSGRRYSADDLQFAQILASRIALALDNAGLFSDLESIERRMDTVMSILDEAVVIHGADGELLFANPAAARTLGFATTEEAISAPTDRIRERFLIRDEGGRELGAEALAGLRDLDDPAAHELTLRVTDRASHRERWYQTRARAIEGTDGGILYSVTAIEDVTDVKRAEFSQRLLARTGELLSHSIDYLGTLDEVARMLVPEFADWCGVSIPRDDGLIEQVAVAHQDPERVRFAEELRRRYPTRVEDSGGAAEALRTGEAQLVSDVSDAMLEQAATDEEHLELLRGVGIGSAIIVPMSAGGEVVGVISFINERESRSFDGDDLELAVEVGRRAGLAVENARLADERARVADALQRELLPPSVPAVPGWEIATMYEPAGEVNEVGGDFYEVFRVESGWAVVLGDVSGRGAAAASLTAEARHTIRTAGQLSADPHAGLRLLDQNLRGREDAALCSVVMVVLPDPGAAAEDVGALVYLAGHPPPLLLRAGEVGEVGEPGPLLGVAERPDWPAASVSLTTGDQLVLYTDGVIEARHGRGERFGSERLHDRLAGCTRPDEAIMQVRQGLADFVARSLEDDAALVVVCRTGGVERVGDDATLTASTGGPRA